MSPARRSPRNHIETSSLLNRRVKAASVSWSDDDYALEQSLISGLELNRRWRSGLFSVVSATSLKTRCHDEIARFLFATHPRFAEAYRVKPGAFVKAVKDRVQTLPDTLAVTALQTARTRFSKAKVTADLYSLRLRQPEIWTQHRQRHDWDSAQWQPRLPLEIQFLILHAYIQSDPEPVEPIDPCAPDIAQICRDSGLPPPPAKKTPSFNRERLLLGGTSPLQAQNHRNLNYHRAATACLVNHGWYTEAVRSLYGTVTLRHPAHFDYMFGRHSVHGVMRQGRPGEHTQVLTLRNPPQNVCRFFDLRSTVPYIRFDLGSSRCFFTQVDEETKKPIEQLGRTTQRIGALATRSVPLYQLTMSLEARMLRLFVSEANPIDSTDDIWQDLIAGHIAALRMMVHVEHLIIDAELYLILLPSYFKTWCRTTEWQVVLEALKAEASEKPMATFFDDTHLETLTFVGSHVPTLAFLARISRAPRVKNINLVGWNQCGMKEEWVTFVKEDRLLVDAMCNWVAEDAAEV